MEDDSLPPVSGEATEANSNLPPAPAESGDTLLGATAALTLPAASLPTGEIAPAEAQAASSPAGEGAATPVALLAPPGDQQAASPAAAPESPLIREPITVRMARWLPTTRQLADAARLRIAAALGPDYETGTYVAGVHTSMRQAFGLIVLVGLISGLSRMIWLWALLARAATVTPLLRLDDWSARLALRFPSMDSFLLIRQQVGGLSPRAPAWVAAGLNAFGAWLSLPMRLLAVWIVYGLLVLLVAKLLGAGTTLPRFYAALGYAALPGLLLIFWPLPIVGLVAAPVAAILALVAAQRAVRATTGLDGVRATMALLLPPVVALALWGLVFAIAVAWIW